MAVKLLFYTCNKVDQCIILAPEPVDEDRAQDEAEKFMDGDDVELNDTMDFTDEWFAESIGYYRPYVG